MTERVLVCGSRTWTDRRTVIRVLSTLAHNAVIIHGNAQGADTIAHQVARALGLEIRVCPARWSIHGRAAGPIRNQAMLDEEHPTRVIAFRVYGPSRGTDDLLRRARQAGLPVEVYQPEVRL